MTGVKLECFSEENLRRFGVKLTQKNIKAHLARIREDRKKYISAHPKEIQFLNRIFHPNSPERSAISHQRSADR